MIKYTFDKKLRCIDCYDIRESKTIHVSGKEAELPEDCEIYASFPELMKNVDKTSCIFVRACILDREKIESTNLLTTMDFSTFFIIAVDDLIDTVNTFIAINVAEIRHAKIIDKSTTADKEYWLYQYNDGSYGIEYITEKNNSYKVGDTLILAK